VAAVLRAPRAAPPCPPCPPSPPSPVLPRLCRRWIFHLSSSPFSFRHGCVCRAGRLRCFRTYSPSDYPFENLARCPPYCNLTARRKARASTEGRQRRFSQKQSRNCVTILHHPPRCHCRNFPPPQIILIALTVATATRLKRIRSCQPHSNSRREDLAIVLVLSGFLVGAKAASARQTYRASPSRHGCQSRIYSRRPGAAGDLRESQQVCNPSL
jgi:hypothetical protein